MLALPVSAARLCLVKFSILLLLAAVQMFFMTLAYFPSAAIASRIQDYNFMLPVMDILREAGIIYISSIPMAAFFWMLAVSIQTPIFSMGVGMASIVPSVLLINTKIWFAYPMCYPFLMAASRMHELASNRTGREEIDDERKTVYCDKYCFNIFPVYNFSDTMESVGIGVTCG